MLASLVPHGAKVADVGTDHGLLPVWLLENHIAVSAVATDIRSGPLSHAERLRCDRGLDNMRCFLCDGLTDVSSDDADTVIIAGMGGENISGILSRAPWTAQGTLLLLQPMSRPEELRRALGEMGIRIGEEHLVEDTGRIYSVIVASAGDPVPLSETELYTGAYDLISGEALFLPMLEALERKTDSAIHGLERAERSDGKERLLHLCRIKTGIEDMRRRYNAQGL